MLKMYILPFLLAAKHTFTFIKYNKIFNRFSDFTMIKRLDYIDNLELCKTNTHINGDVVECGVWRGGMIAGMSTILGTHRQYFLFDSFEGLPGVTEKDGNDAKKWQTNTSGATYFENCKAEIHFAKNALERADCKTYHIEKGWFEITLPTFNKTHSISILRLDGDWYESTMCCLENLYPKVVAGGLIIIDDYYTWEGCSKAVHDYLSKHQLTDRIEMSKNGVCYIRKK